MRRVIFPENAEVRAIFGAGLREGNSDEERRRAARAYRLRLDRAQARGVLPPRVYVSPRKYGWWDDELAKAFSELPRSYASFPQAG